MLHVGIEPPRRVWWNKLVTGEAPDLPAGYTPCRKDEASYYAVIRRIVSDTFLKPKGSGVDPGRMGEDVRWLHAVDRYRRSFKETTRSGSNYRVHAQFFDYLRQTQDCRPAGYAAHPSAPVKTCRRPSACLFCYARGCGDAYADLVRCYARRPDPDSPVHLFVRATGFPEWGRKRADPDELLRANDAAGGVVCRLPIKSLSGGVLIGIGSRKVPRSTPLTGTHALAVIGDTVVRHMAYPPGWCKPSKMCKILTAAAELRQSGRLAARTFDPYGLCRKTGSGRGRTAMRYTTGGRPPKETGK